MLISVVHFCDALVIIIFYVSFVLQFACLTYEIFSCICNNNYYSRSSIIRNSINGKVRLSGLN